VVCDDADLELVAELAGARPSSTPAEVRIRQPADRADRVYDAFRALLERGLRPWAPA
jgi:hypothetical protein